MLSIDPGTKPIKKVEPKSKTASFSTKSRNLPQFRSGFTSGWNPNSMQASRPRLLKALVFGLVILGIGFLGGWLGARAYNYSPRPAASTAIKQQHISDESSLIASIAQTVGQSVVSVDVQSQVAAQDPFGFTRPVAQASAGTGFIINTSGIIVTNRHVVPAGTTSISVTLGDGTRYDNVQLIGRTTDGSPLDVAFLKITDLKGKTLTPVTLGDSSKMQVGYRVIAIGNALGQFQNTVTTGILSGYGRDVTASDQSGGSTETLTDLFQTDAAINPGNSGGPLVDINGEVIGLNTATAGNAQNIGFSIPINDVKGLIDGVLATGKLKQSYLGVHYISLTADVAYDLNLSIKRGAYIVSSNNQPAVVPASPAEKAGLREKDIITRVKNTTIDQKTSLSGALSQYQPGETVKLTVVRGSKTMTINVTLGDAPQS